MSKIQVRRGTAAQWTTANPVLASGEIGFETDTNKFKIGDGTTAWASAVYSISPVADYVDAVGINPASWRTELGIVLPSSEIYAGGDKTFVPADNKKFIVCTSSSDITLGIGDIPAGDWANETEIMVEQSGTGNITIGGVFRPVLRSALSPIATTTRFQVLTIRRTGPDSWVVY